MKSAVLVLGALALIGALAVAGSGRSANANSPGSVDVPLLTCSDVSADGPVSSLDFFALLGKFGTTRALSGVNFAYLYDLDATDSITGIDIFAVLGDFGQTCPTVDTQVALATRWGIGASVPPECSAGNPSPPLMESEVAIEAIGYYRGSSDVPGQGVHYTKSELFDNVFDPCRPEGLVYSGGRLVAQLYVINGDAAGIGWNGWDPGSGGGALSGIDVDSFCSPSPCSWATDEGWHAHANLCTTSIGTTGAFAFPGQSESSCDTGSNPQPECTVPVTVTPCWSWNNRVGWMGHLWNHDLNENLEPSENNGRFSDCAPPAPKYNQCPM
jgi:hypothetical protein